MGIGRKMTKEETSWILYDVGNSAFVLVMITALMPIFFKDVAAVGMAGATSTANWGFANSTASLILAVLSPLLGAMADYRGRKKLFFLCFLFLGISFNLLLSLVGEGQWHLCLALFVIARELGLPSWAKLKAHIAAMTQASDAIKTKALAPDAEFKTLHIRCGTDLRSTLPAGGFIGDFLEYSDPYGQGPIVQNDDFIKTRAKFLHESYDPLFEKKLDDSRADKTLSDTVAYLETADARLKLAAQQYERVILWFEHDGYDPPALPELRVAAK